MSDYFTEDHGPRIEALKRSHADFERKTDFVLSDVQSKLADLERSVEEHRWSTIRRFEVLEGDLQEAKEEAESRSDGLEESISAADAGTERVARRVAALERQLRQAEGAVVADLDSDRGGKLRGLGLAVEEGLAAEEELLSPHKRAGVQSRISHLEQAREALAGHRATVRQAAEVLASTAAGDPRRAQAEKEFTSAATAAHETQQRVAHLVRAAQGARAQLAADDALRARAAGVIEAGQRAHTQLRVRLRSRLSDALSGSELLPVWFATALGPMAPSRRAEEWLETALDVLAYRVTYQVTDAVLALGSTPDGSNAPRRTARFRELERELRDWG
ncbi:CopG family transcriptional regulator [Streptomyces sp. NPDC093801]|uniref:CopG family transcriptional regulator n=1 Tax=Streptomyces sp. NPDC093801 TaxID=3155203 RepID=UPI00344F6B53